MKEHSRYDRQMILRQIGREGQRRLDESCVAVVGIGALGTVSANLLARAGVGRILLIDRDFLELNNLQRQILYDEQDVKDGLPKAIAAKRRLEEINSEIRIDAETADLNPATIDHLLSEADLIIDGTDNFETRFLLNDYALKKEIPWIYGGALRTEGMSYVILPGQPPCLRCLFGEAPKHHETQTCNQVGVIATVSHLIASFQATEAIKILVQHDDWIDRRLWKVDVWNKTFKSINVDHLREWPCSGCRSHDYPYLAVKRGTQTLSLCGRNAVQVYGELDESLDFSKLAERVRAIAEVRYNDHILNIRTSPYEITVFKNGRAIIKGTEDRGQARSLYSRYVGS